MGGCHPGITAARKSGLDSINADVKQGTRRDAQWYSFGANKAHGLRRAKGDAKRAIEKILNDPEWSKVPQTEIAKHVGVNRSYVSQIQSHLVSTNKIERGPVEVTRNGTTYTQNTQNIGKRPDITATTNQTEKPDDAESPEEP